MREAAIVSTARTGVARAFKGALNDTDAPEFTGHVMKAAIERAGIDPKRIDDVLIGVGTQFGTQGSNLARTAIFAAGLPISLPGTTLDRKCGSGLTTLAFAARGIMANDMDVALTGGAESITHTRNQHTPTYRAQPKAVLDRQPHAYMAMIETAEIVADKYGISREQQDAIAAISHQRAAAATDAGRLGEEITPITVTRNIIAKDGSVTGREEVILSSDEGIRADTTAEKLAGLKPVWKDGQIVKEGQHVTAGNASQLSDGAAAQILMERSMAEAEGKEILGIFRGFQSAGCPPEEMGIGPVFAIPRLLDRAGLKVEDIGLWEINEAFASQYLYCRDKLGIDPEKINVNGGAIALGHPFGMTGARLTGSILLEARRRGVRYAVVSMCVAGGMGSAGLFEIPG
ncbi:acetyl-CoA C-acyltransferase [Altererythrobacter indicus]|uniref:acetyl-CoA C-acyltransferase n=1 Tax=Altericroceibacterium indicum TaxID=374177 RepID=A0A845A5X9_9SPHN|nr:thiolase family protein [Altericroceibacterium indicum]MXP24673.1 acetyl-CoA C-acyltransferase [Altericroceibacterium indicum]